jgi:hypothetical protein
MSNNPLARRTFLRTLALAGGAYAAAPLWAADPEGLKEPIYRVSKAEGGLASGGDQHPLDPALDMAREFLVRSQRDITDYTCTMIKRERIKGTLTPYEYVHAKIRNRKMEGEQLKVPLSVYLYFLKPDDVKGREVIWVEAKNNGKMRAHESRDTIKGKLLPSVWLDPLGPIAMHNQLHPIMDIGIENLIEKLIEKGEKDRAHGECEVEWVKGVKLNGQMCTVLNVRHPIQRPHFEFHIAQIFIHDELQVPVRYAAYHWPTDSKDKTGPVIEEYTHVDIKVNVGLTDADFDPENPNYAF